jgi:hypothetical protein
MNRRSFLALPLILAVPVEARSATDIHMTVVTPNPRRFAAPIGFVVGGGPATGFHGMHVGIAAPALIVPVSASEMQLMPAFGSALELLRVQLEIFARAAAREICGSQREREIALLMNDCE